jgi:hypothetical protein
MGNYEKNNIQDSHYLRLSQIRRRARIQCILAITGSLLLLTASVTCSLV